MKKLCLLFAAFLVCVIFVPAQDRETLSRLQREEEQLNQDYFLEKITLDEFQKRFTELDRQIQVLMQRLEKDSPSFSQAQLKRIEDLMEQTKRLEAQFNDKLISQDEYSRRVLPMEQEYERTTRPFEGSAAAGRQIKDLNDIINSRWPGMKTGWPAAFGKDSVGELCGLGPFRQSVGTRASYSFGRHSVYGPVNIYSIYQTGADNLVLNDLKDQIERAAGKTMRNEGDNNYRMDIVNSYGRQVYLEVYMYNDVVCLNIGRNNN